MAYMDCMDLDVRCPSKAVKLNPSLTHLIGTVNHCCTTKAILTLSLTHWGLVTPYGDIVPGQHWLR